MSLDLGELVGSIGLDITPMVKAVNAGDARLNQFAAEGESTAKAAGNSIGVAMATGLATIPVDASTAAAGVKSALDQIPVDAKVAADQAAGSVKMSLDQIPVDAKATAAATAVAFGVGVDDISRLMDELPKNAKGVVSETSAEFRALAPDVKVAVLQAKADAATALQGIPPEARKAGQEAATQLGAGLSGAKAEAEAAGARAGDGFASSFADKAKDAGKVTGAAVGTALSVGVIDNLSLEGGRLKVAAQLGLTATEADRLGRIAGRVYAHNFGEGIDEVNVAVAAVISSIRGMRNASESDIGRATRLALAFADVFDIDVQRAVSVAGTVLRSGLADNAMQAFNLITQASSRVPADLREDVLDAAEEYSQFFDTLGYSGEQAFSMLVEGAKKGMYGIDKAGDAVKEFTIRSTDMSTSSKQAYKMIGLDARTMANDILAGGDKAQRATQKIVRGLLDIKDPARQGQAAIALFGTPLEDLNASEIPQFLKQLQGSSKAMDGWEGSARKMATTAGGGTANSIETAKRKVIEWGRSVIEAHGPTTMLAGAVAAFGPAALSIIGPTAQIIGARAAQTAAAGSAAAAETAAATATKTGWLTSAATAMASAVRMAAAWVIAMGPIAIAIAAIAGVAYLVYKYWDEIKAATMAVWDWIVGFIKDHATLIVTVLTGPIGFVVMTVIKHWDDIKAGTAAAWDWVVGKVKAIPGLLVAAFLNFTLPGLIIKHWDTIKEKTSAAWDAVVGFVKGIPGKLLSFFMNWTLPGLIIKHWDEAKDGTVRVATSIVNWVGDLPGKILGKLASLGGMLFEANAQAFGRMLDAAQNKATALLSWVSGLPGRVKNKLGNLGQLLYNAGMSIIQGLIDGIEDKAGDLMGKLQGITDKIPDWKGPASKDRRLLRGVGQMIMQGLIDAIGAKEGDLKSSLDEVTKLIEKTMAKRFKNDKLAQAAARAVIKGLEDERKELLANERARDRIDKKLDAAREKLRSLRQEAREYAKSVQDAVVSFGNVTSFVDQQTGTVTADSIVAGLKLKVMQAASYSAAMAQLVTMGLNQTTIDQLTQAGVEGGLATASALLAGGQTAIDQVNQLTGQLVDTGAGLGSMLSDQMYGDGIAAAQQLVNGLEAQKAELEKSGRRLARAFLRALRQELGSGLGDLGINISDFHTSNPKNPTPGPDPKTAAAARRESSVGATTDPALVEAVERLAEAQRATNNKLDALPRKYKLAERQG
ncbi:MULTISPECIES: phage tail tape measure protein [unclassified Nocardioides]|uniref:phage tail tape measure protein n=1 Tax=unclassified Nocardioides TaxID=2615069 RepID=UPI0009EF88E2|nr:MULTISPECIES: phage tail tape measure protein [unclassified Nocardioides]GAW50618.1 hypothetical protein PD653B2_2954 [Nocardioides sp. PD653-B2]GAW55517.1 hypothetical protein PD653_2942 [Nocardioides sp. PD653]